MKKKRRTAPSPRAAAAFAAFVTFATYVRTLSFDFTYDDHHHFVDNAFVHDLSNLSRFLPWRYFESAIPDQGRPVLVLSELLDVALGASAAACHLHSGKGVRRFRLRRRRRDEADRDDRGNDPQPDRSRFLRFRPLHCLNPNPRVNLQMRSRV